MRRFLSFMIILCIFTSIITVMPTAVNAKSETYYGYIDKYTILSDSFGAGTILFKIYDKLGSEFIYSSSNLKINGIQYTSSNIEELKNNFPMGVFVKYTLSSRDEITSIVYDTDAEVYTDVTYNPTNKCFVGIEKDIASLPVYYKNNGEFTEPILEENHKYSIEVYDYAVYITSFSVLNKNVTLTALEIDCSIVSSKYQTMNIACDSTDNTAYLVAQIFKADKDEIIAEKKVEYENGYYLTIDNLPNDNVKYNVNLFLENSNGDIISYIYKKSIDTIFYPVSYGYIFASYNDYFINDYLMVEIMDNKGNFLEKASTANLLVNGEAYDFETEIPEGIFASYILVNDKIAVLNYDISFETYNNAVYKSSTSENPNGYFDLGDKKISLDDKAAYYKYNDEFVEPILDENHKYSIEVYDCAVNITAISANNGLDTILNIQTETYVDANLKKFTGIFCEAINRGRVLNCEIYDKDLKLVSAKKTEIDNEDYFVEFENLNGSYTAKLWLEDESGNVKSPIYKREFKSEEIRIAEGFIDAYGCEVDCFGNIIYQIRMNEDGNMIIYSTNKISVNGINCSDESDFDLQTGAYAKYAVCGDKIYTLNYDEASILISNFEYVISDNELILDLSVDNYTDTDKNVSVIVASYKLGKLDELLCIPTTLVAKKTNDLRKTIPNENDADELKVFIWDGLENMIPYNYALKTNIEN